jgi:hypothetical protein
MATWIAHLRIADKLLKILQIDNIDNFIVGNLGPDCGVPNSDWSSFHPSSDISHWKDIETKEIKYQQFYDKYCYSNCVDSFYFGYFIHLLSDVFWSELVLKKKKYKYNEELKKDKNFIWVMKKDWYDLDKKYLLGNELDSYNKLKRINDFPNKYLDYFPKDAFTERIKYIVNYYHYCPKQ